MPRKKARGIKEFSLHTKQSAPAASLTSRPRDPKAKSTTRSPANQHRPTPAPPTKLNKPSKCQTPATHEKPGDWRYFFLDVLCAELWHRRAHHMGKPLHFKYFQSSTLGQSAERRFTSADSGQAYCAEPRSGNLSMNRLLLSRGLL
jgi:hypothetical protein